MRKFYGALGCFLLLFSDGTLVSAQDILQRPLSDQLNLAHEVENRDIAADHVSYLSGCCVDCGCGDTCGDDCCDVCGCGGAKPKKKPKPTCAGSHKGIYYANNFNYLKDTCYKGDCLGDCMKLLPLAGGNFSTLDIGGELRLRYHHEEGMGRQPGRLGFQETTNDFMLTRLRLYTNWTISDNVRFYSEAIFADVEANDLYVPRPIDRNSADFLNLFFDFQLTDNTIVRIGRQELLYGAQRTVSPLDWANTRRTFEGIRTLTKRGDWSVDAFYTNFVPVSADNFDEADYDRSFYGMYTTYRGMQDKTLDVYYLGFDHQTAGTPVASDFSLHTVGGRFTGNFNNISFMFDLEGAFQGGRQSGLGLDHEAGFCTCGIGKKIDVEWDPTIWFYYDYASGNTVSGDFNRYNQLFPLAHKYLGFIDAVARSNVESPNMLVTMKPSKKLSLLCWYYYLGANQAQDVIPGVAVPSAQNLTSKDFGNELDLIAKYQLNPRSDILLGYSHLWRGNKIIGTDDASFFYSQFSLQF